MIQRSYYFVGWIGRDASEQYAEDNSIPDPIYKGRSLVWQENKVSILSGGLIDLSKTHL